jgi:hypothetical protein
VYKYFSRFGDDNMPTLTVSIPKELKKKMAEALLKFEEKRKKGDV